MVLKITDFDPVLSAPSAAASANVLMCILHGVTMLQVEAIPICGLEKSSSSNPTARNIALEGACSTPSTIIEECFLLSFDMH